MPSSALARSRKPRRGTELVCEKVFRPLAHPLVVVFAWLRVPPPARGRRGRRGRHRGGRRGARPRLAARCRAPRPAEDAARQRGRPARAPHRPDQRLRAVSRLRGRPARQRWRSSPRLGWSGRAAGARVRRVPRAHERPQPQLQRRAAVAGGASRSRRWRRRIGRRGSFAASTAFVYAPAGPARRGDRRAAARPHQPCERSRCSPTSECRRSSPRSGS